VLAHEFGKVDIMNTTLETVRLLVSSPIHYATRLARNLPLRRRFGLRFHLLLCKWCRRYGKQITFLRNAAHEHPDEMAEPVPQKLSDEARERIKQRLGEHS